MTADECFEDNAANWSWDDRVGLGPADPRKPLSARQAELLEIVRRDNRVSVREIGERMGGIAANAVAGHIKALIDKRYLTKTNGKCRSLTVLPPPKGDDLA